MKRTFLAATLALLPLVFACQPEIDAPGEQEPCATCEPEVAMPEVTAVPATAQSPEEPSTLERKSGTALGDDGNARSSGDLGATGSLTGVPFVTLEEVETVRYEEPWYVHVERDYYVTFWADRARTIPINLGSGIQLNYLSTYYTYLGRYSMKTNLSTYLPPGSHSYYIGNGTYECNYNASGDPEYRCDETWLTLRTGTGYDGSW